jgi:predicted ATP-dependent endonuclease of OLD family
MKITRIVIHNYRSIKHDSINPSDFNIFVGRNNHGKTNFFEAVEWFFNGQRRGEDIQDICHGQSNNDEVFVEIEFAGALDSASRMTNDRNKTSIEKLLNGTDVVTIRRTSTDIKTRKITVNGVTTEKPPSGFDNALNDFLPKFEYVDTKKFYSDLTKYGKTTPVGSMLSGVLEVLLEDNPEYQGFQKKFQELFGDEKSQVKAELDKLSGKVKVYLEKQFPECVRVEFSVGEPTFEDLLKNFSTTIDDGVITNAEEKGDGMQRALMLAIIQTYCDYRKEREDIGKTFLFFIDEAELHLHPTAQRNLKNALLEISQKGDQVFINTHSSVFIADETGIETIYRVEKIDKKTNASPITAIEKQALVYELLGGSPADLLLPRNFLIVEGTSDRAFINEMIKRFYSDKPLIQVISSNGDIEKQSRSMDAINAAYVPLGIATPIYKETIIILCDKVVARETDKTKFLQSYPHLQINSQFYELPEDAIEKYFPSPWGKTDDEIKELDKEMNGKLKYARDQVAPAITQIEFETQMQVVFQALSKCWELAY